jgi:hypothetical protein
MRETVRNHELGIAPSLSWLANLIDMTSQAERRLYNLRDMLKVQFRATQKAQVNERRTADSKRRLTSCVAL